MISAEELYQVLSAMVPLYVAMILAYGSVRWWKCLTPEQCGGINRFVAIFAVPFLSFHIIASNNPYKMNVKFVAADTLQKIAVFLLLGLWAKYSRRGSLEWMITLFMLATLPNTLVMGIPLLAAMYGADSGSLVVQAVVLQCIIWYTILLFLYEFRSAKILISDQFPDTAASIVSFKVDSDVMSLDGREPIQTEAELKDDGKLHVTVRRSTSSRPNFLASPPRRSVHGPASMSSSKAITPRPSNLTGAEIYSIQSSRNITPRESSFSHMEFNPTSIARPVPGSPRHSNFTSSDIYSLHSSRGATPRTSNFTEEHFKDLHPQDNKVFPMRYSHSDPTAGNSYAPRPDGSCGGTVDASRAGRLNCQGTMATAKHASSHNTMISKDTKPSAKPDDDSKESPLFLWSSGASAVPPAAGDAKQESDVKIVVGLPNLSANAHLGEKCNETERDDFSFGNRMSFGNDYYNNDAPNLTKMKSNSTAELAPKGSKNDLPPATVLFKLILSMVWRKLVRNPNTYSSLLGITWALVSNRWNINMPIILDNSIAIISKAGLGMAMFSLGLFMALQKKLLACGTPLSLFGMVVRFLTGPATMAAAAIAVRMHGVDLRVSIVQAALPQGIVPFVFAKEYGVHPDVLSTAVIFGMLVALPIALVYYILLGL